MTKSQRPSITPQRTGTNGRAKAFKSSPGQPKSTKTSARPTMAAKRAATPVTGRPAARQNAVDLLVELPGGAARITIEAEADVRRTARAWLRVIEQLTRTSSLSAEDLRAELDVELVTEAAHVQLVPSEQDELAEAGARAVGDRHAEAARRKRVDWQVVTLAGAFDVAEVAQRLGVDPTRIRQRLRGRTLYGLRVQGRSWRLPRFQFDETGREIPHMGEVLRALPPDLHPRSVEGFLLAPTPELSADGKPTGPRDWLRSGGPADPVVALATALAAQ